MNTPNFQIFLDHLRLPAEQHELDRDFATATLAAFSNAQTRFDVLAIRDIVHDAHQWRLNAGVIGPFFTKDALIEANAVCRGYQNWNAHAGSIPKGPVRERAAPGTAAKVALEYFLNQASLHNLVVFVRLLCFDEVPNNWQMLSEGMITPVLAAAVWLRDKQGRPIDLSRLYAMTTYEHIQKAAVKHPGLYDDVPEFILDALKNYAGGVYFGENSKIQHSYKLMQIIRLRMIGTHYDIMSNKVKEEFGNGGGGWEIPVNLVKALAGLTSPVVTTEFQEFPRLQD